MEDKTLEFDKELFEKVMETERMMTEKFEKFKEEYFPDTEVTMETMEELSNGKGEDENVEQSTSELHEDISE